MHVAPPFRYTSPLSTLTSAFCTKVPCQACFVASSVFGAFIQMMKIIRCIIQWRDVFTSIVQNVGSLSAGIALLSTSQSVTVTQDFGVGITISDHNSGVSLVQSVYFLVESLARGCVG